MFNYKLATLCFLPAVALQKSSAHSYFHLVLRVLNPLLHINQSTLPKIWNMHLNTSPGSISKQCTLNNHWKHPWSVQNSLFERKICSICEWLLSKWWHKGYLYCRMNQKTHSLEHLKIFLWQGHTEQHQRPLSRQCWKRPGFTRKTILSFSTLNLLCALCAQ